MVEGFDYFYGREAEQFTFFRIPKVLFSDKRFKNMSTDAKLLYIRLEIHQIYWKCDNFSV